MSTTQNQDPSQLIPQETKPRCWGEYRAHEFTSTQNLVNAFLCLIALVPSVFVTSYTYTQCDQSIDDFDTFWHTSCTLSLHYPIAMANILFFVNVAIGFWVVGMIQRNFWLIDPYWTLIPPLLAHFYQLNPLASANAARSAISITLIWVWATRLTFSYFRREEWKFGQREDWRYTKMAQENPTIWPLLSFFAVGVAQQPMLIGIALPAYSVHRSDDAFGIMDVVAAVVCVTGLTLAYVADTQLYDYMEENERRGKSGEAKRLVLDTGVWKYSRHPNYVGETTWWFGYGLFAVSVGQWFMLSGWVLNTAVLLQVTCMTEERMRTNRQGERLEAFLEYCAATPCWIPGPWHCVGALVGQKGGSTATAKPDEEGALDAAAKPMLP